MSAVIEVLTISYNQKVVLKKAVESCIITNPSIRRNIVNQVAINLTLFINFQTSDAQCKKNLLADIMEASGILLENTARNKALKEKSNYSYFI